MDAAALGAPIAAGRTAQIYPWSDGTILKLFHSWVPLADAALERRNAAAAKSCGVATPAVHDVVQHGERWGLVFDRVDGPTMLDKVVAEPGAMERWARELARLHVALHQAPVGDDLPDQRRRLSAKIRACHHLTPGERDAVLDLLFRLPAGTSLCHGDFHPGNIVMTADEPMIIDWVDATIGNPVADVARTSVVLLGHIKSTGVDESATDGLSAFHRTYVEEYMATVPERKPEYERWLVVIAAARLSEEIAAERDWLLSTVREGLRT